MVSEMIVRNWYFSYVPSAVSQCDWLRAQPLPNVAVLDYLK
jgi:hypothetical protein